MAVRPAGRSERRLARQEGTLDLSASRAAEDTAPATDGSTKYLH
jgi:hypothetical protein